MKRYINISTICALIVAMFLLGSCTAEYRSHHHHDDEHVHDTNQDDHH